MGFTMLISFFTTRVTLQILGVEDYGLNNVVASMVSLFSFLNSSMGTAVQRFYAIEIGKDNLGYLSRVFGTGLFLHAIVAGITLILLEIFAFFFLERLNIPHQRYFAAQFVFQVSIFSSVLYILVVPFLAFLKAREEFSKIAALDIIRAILNLVVLYLLFIIPFDKIIALSILYLCITIAYVSFIIKFALKFDEIEIRFFRDKYLIKKMLSFISMLIFTLMASVINKQGIVVLVNLFFGLTINAAYAIAVQVSHLMDSFAMNFKQSVVPQLMQAYGGNNLERMNKLMFFGTKVSYLLMLLISIPIFFESDFLINIWLEDPPMYAANFTKLIIIGANINTFYYFIYQGVHASGNIRKQQLLSSFSYLMSIIVIYISFVLGGGFYYAAIIPIFFSIIRNVIVIISAKETIDFAVNSFLTRVIIPCIVITILLVSGALIPFVLLDSSVLRLLNIVFISLIISIFLGPLILLNSYEKQVIKELIKRKLIK